MKILLIGSQGQLGTEIIKIFPGVTAVDLPEVDVTVPETVERAVDASRPDVILNTSAYHNVPDCEKNIDLAFRVNAFAVRNLAEICKARGLAFVHVSTDYVFDGRKNAPYTEADVPNPLNAYGVSKLAGEFFARKPEKSYVVRLSSVFGVAGCRGKGGKNFVKSMLEFAKTRDKVQITSNIISSPTYAADAAAKIKELLEKGYPPGLYHLANGGSCSWHEFALEIFRLTGARIAVEERFETEELAGVLRPMNSALVSTKIAPVRSWQDALKANLKEEGYTLQEASS